MKRIEQNLRHLKSQEALRTLDTRRPRIDFASNDYLGFAQHEGLRLALRDVLASDFELGATGSRLLTGNSPLHVRVESFLKDTFHAPSALLFPSGYTANLALLSAVGDEESSFFSDSLNHASLIDGMRLSRAQKFIFRHNDVDDLETKLRACKSSRKIIVTESVFSMDGDLAPLEEMHKLARKYQAWMIVDEAHATGIFGARGLGRVDHRRDEGDRSILISVHTASKALGAQGAFILAPEIIKQYLINHARAFIYTTGISPILAAQIELSVREVVAVNARGVGAGVLAQAARLRNALGPHFDFGRSESQIIPVLLGSNAKTIQVAERCQARGFDVRAIRSPTVAAGTERVRLTVKALHTPAQIDDLARTLVENA